MNYLIAVVTDSYENCMMKMQAQSFKVKVEMISEQEEMMTDEELQNAIYFPKYIVVRSVAGNQGVEEDHQW